MEKLTKVGDAAPPPEFPISTTPLYLVMIKIFSQLNVLSSQIEKLEKAKSNVESQILCIISFPYYAKSGILKPLSFNAVLFPPLAYVLSQHLSITDKTLRY